MAKTRLVETEEDVETYRPVLDAIKAAIGDRQAELARLEGELSAVGGKTAYEDDDLSVSVHWTDTPSPCQGVGGGSRG